MMIYSLTEMFYSQLVLTEFLLREDISGFEDRAFKTTMLLSASEQAPESQLPCPLGDI